MEPILICATLCWFLDVDREILLMTSPGQGGDKVDNPDNAGLSWAAGLFVFFSEAGEE